MNRTNQWILLAAALVAGTHASAAVARENPNVLVIMPDDLSYSDYSYFNRSDCPEVPRTPNVERLGRESVRLTDFHVAPTCSPSRAQLMTGRYDDACGVWHTILGRYFLRTNEVTMTDVFQANGYRTAMFGKWHLGETYPFRPQDRGFEHTVMIHGGGIDQQPDFWGNRNTVPCVLYNDGRPVVLNNENASLPGPVPGWQIKSGVPLAFATDYFTAQAMDYMKTCQDKHEPFFVYLPYNVAHEPDDRPPDARNGVDAHTATIENMDKNMGRLLQFLDHSGLADNTLLIFILGDNGMANFKFRGDKASEYEAGHRVPCFIRWPGGGYGGSPASAWAVPQLTSEMDWLPTLMDVLRLHDVADRSSQVPIQGCSLRTLLEGHPADHNPILAKRVLVVDNQRLDQLVKYKQACVMQDALGASGNILHQWRLIRPSASQPWELYDIQADEWEQTNLQSEPESGQFAGVVRTLQAAYEHWWSQISVEADDYSRLIAGSTNEPVICLYAHDWHTDGDVPWNQTKIAAGMAANGFNAVAFARAGEYTFDLRRWPREVGGATTVDSQLHVPIRIFASNALTYGRALPVRSARIRVWNGAKTYADEHEAVAADSTGAVFKLKLPAGPAMVQTWFYDASRKELCGAYYDYVSLGESEAGPNIRKGRKT